MKQGDSVLIWGATGGIGGYAMQYVLNGGGTPSASCRPERRPRSCGTTGLEAVIDRRAEDYRFWADEHTQDESEWRRLGKNIRGLVGEDPDIVFEHPGRSDVGCVDLRGQARRHGRHVCGDVGLHGRVRQPPLLDEAEAADRPRTSPTTPRRTQPTG